jgi:cardiolipin synthase
MNAWFPRLTMHTLVIVISVLTYVLTTRIGEERRPPSIAIAWVLGLIAVPYLALPMYLFFGRRKLLRKPCPSGIRSHSPHWAEELIESFGLPAAAPSQVRMHTDAVESSAALFEIMAGAENRLDICTYILGNDDFGRIAIDRMIESAQRGVRVRLLIDGYGAIQLPRACFKRLRAGGVETATFSPFLARKTANPRNLRDHRKLVIADGAWLWAGGRNLAAEYFSGRKGTLPWRDLTFDLQGLAAHSAAAQFETDWTASGGARAAPASNPTFAHSGSRTQFLPSGPDQSEDTVHALLIDACFRVEHRMLAVTPYFVPDVSLETAMRLAAHRGVRIDLVIPATSNHRLADFARSRALRALSDAGVFVHLLPYMIHAKGVVFDSTLALSGSVNLDSRSLLLNYECAVVFYGSKEIDWLASWIQALIPDSKRFEARAPGLWRDLCEGLLLTVAFQL